MNIEICIICHKKYDVPFQLGTDCLFYCDDCIKNRYEDVCEARRKDRIYWANTGEQGVPGDPIAYGAIQKIIK